MSKHKYSDEERIIFSNNLKLFMKLHNLSTRILSKETSIPYTTLSDWINGRNYPSPKYIKILEKYFYVNFHEFEKERNEKEEFEMENDYLMSLVKSTLSDANNNFTSEQKKQIIKICKKVLDDSN